MLLTLVVNWGRSFSLRALVFVNVTYSAHLVRNIWVQEALCGLLYRKAGIHDGKMRKEILYADFVLRESARQVSFVMRRKMCFLRIQRFRCTLHVSMLRGACAQVVNRLPVNAFLPYCFNIG